MGAIGMGGEIPNQRGGVDGREGRKEGESAREEQEEEVDTV